MRAAPLFAALTLLIATGNAGAQERKDIFADPKNLKVLPEDISPDELRSTMRGFAMGLGVRCETCHVGEPGQPLDQFDFASDDKEKKRIARKMMAMVSAINGDHINKLDADRTQVQCITCHRGVLKPQTTSMVLQGVLEMDGVDAAAARYRELRERYHGTHSYDFSESVLADLAQDLFRAGDSDGAMQLLLLNDEFFPDSFRNHWLKGEVAMGSADNAAARVHFEKALAIGADPRSEAYLRQRLESLAEQ